MLEPRYCDFCGLLEDELKQLPNGAPKLEVDPDGLQVCSDCRARLDSASVGQSSVALDEKIEALVGKSVGAICYTLNLPYKPPYRFIIDAASLIGYDQDLYMGAWLLVTQWPDGTTVWRAEDGRATSIVTPDGAIKIQE